MIRKLLAVAIPCLGLDLISVVKIGLDPGNVIWSFGSTFPYRSSAILGGTLSIVNPGCDKRHVFGRPSPPSKELSNRALHNSAILLVHGPAHRISLSKRQE